MNNAPQLKIWGTATGIGIIMVIAFTPIYGQTISTAPGDQTVPPSAALIADGAGWKIWLTGVHYVTLESAAKETLSDVSEDMGHGYATRYAIKKSVKAGEYVGFYLTAKRTVWEDSHFLAYKSKWDGEPMEFYAVGAQKGSGFLAMQPGPVLFKIRCNAGDAETLIGFPTNRLDGLLVGTDPGGTLEGVTIFRLDPTQLDKFRGKKVSVTYECFMGIKNVKFEVTLPTGK